MIWWLHSNLHASQKFQINYHTLPSLTQRKKCSVDKIIKNSDQSFMKITKSILLCHNRRPHTILPSGTIFENMETKLCTPKKVIYWVLLMHWNMCPHVSTKILHLYMVQKIECGTIPPTFSIKKKAFHPKGH